MDRKLNITLTDASRKGFPFSDLRAFYEFAVQERDFWKEQQARVSGNQLHPFLTIHSHFEGVVNAIDSWRGKLEGWAEDEFARQLQNLQNQHIQHINNHWLWSGNPCVENYVQCHIEYGNAAAETFANLVLKKQLPNTLNNINLFYGALAGYEYLVQDSPVVKRRNGEKVSLGHLRTQLAEAKDRLFTEVEEFKSDYSGWYSDTKGKSERLYQINKRLGERLARKENKAFDEQLRLWSNAVQELENTYEEKLKLSKPAEYWNKAAKKYGFQAGLFSLAIVAAVVVGLIYFREFFITWLQGQKMAVQLNTIEGIVLFGSIAAVYAYLIKVFSRLAFSSFHLMRDAEEREQLTYLYLSLSKDTDVDKESRDIVLQALFSRSETGLLAQDHGPTMPVASEVLRTAMKGKV